MQKKQSLQLNVQLQTEWRTAFDEIAEITGIADQALVKALITALYQHWNTTKQITFPLQFADNHDWQVSATAKGKHNKKNTVPHQVEPPFMSHIREEKSVWGKAYEGDPNAITECIKFIKKISDDDPDSIKQRDEQLKGSMASLTLAHPFAKALVEEWPFCKKWAINARPKK